jgi:hypothetical protein
MAKKPVKKTTTTTVETVEPPDDDRAPLLETGADLGEQFDDPLAELLGLGDDIRWTVFKISGKPGEKGGYCDTYTGAALSLEVLRETWGGGRYRIQGNRQDGTWAKQKTVEILAPLKPAATTQPTPLASQPLSELAQLISAVRPQQDSSGSDKVLQALTAMIDSQGKLLAGLLSRPAPEGPKLLDILALIKAGREEEKGIDVLLKGIALGKDLGGGGSDNPELALAGQGLAVIREIIAKKDAQPAGDKPAPALPKPAPTPAATATAPTNGATAPPAEDQAMLEKINWLRAQTATLVFQAQRGRDPELYAAVMLDNLPDYISDEEIQQRMAAPDAVAQLAAIDPRVAQLAPWFEEFRQAVLAMLAEEPEPAAKAPPLPDGTGNAEGTEELV